MSTMPNPNRFTVFELDDFTCDEASLYAITKLKQRYPSFRATLFTVMGKCDLAKLEHLLKLEWLEIAVHGSDHATERFWDFEQASRFLNYAYELGCTALFKMPWDDLPTDGFIAALKANHYFFATRNRYFGSYVYQKAGIPVYLGCPQSVWVHPFQLDNRIDTPMSEPFLTVGEAMQLQVSVEQGWVLA